MGPHSSRQALQGAWRETHPARCDEIDLQRQPLGRGDADSSTEAMTRQRGLADHGFEKHTLSLPAFYEDDLELRHRGGQHDARKSSSRSDIDNYAPTRIETGNRRQGLSIVTLYDLIASSGSHERNSRAKLILMLIMQPELLDDLVSQLHRRAAPKP